MSCITIVKEIKAIHPKDIALIRLGGFYRVYGRDAYIISNIFRYKVQYDEGIASCGFPVKSISKIQSKLENKKINYMIIDSRDNYSIESKEDYKNLNNYDKQYEISKIYVHNQLRIDNIYKYLSENSKKENLKEILKGIEEIINAKGKI